MGFCVLDGQKSAEVALTVWSMFVDDWSEDGEVASKNGTYRLATAGVIMWAPGTSLILPYLVIVTALVRDHLTLVKVA